MELSTAHYGQLRLARVNPNETVFYHHDYPNGVRGISKYNPAPADNVSLVAVYHYEVFGKLRTRLGQRQQITTHCLPESRRTARTKPLGVPTVVGTPAVSFRINQHRDLIRKGRNDNLPGNLPFSCY